MSDHTRYQDVTEAELARERRYEKRRERAAKVERAKRLADLREAEEMQHLIPLRGQDWARGLPHV